MAAVFDLDDVREATRAATDTDRDPVDQAFALIAGHVRELDTRSAVRRIRRYRGELAALETEVLARQIAADGDDRKVKRMLNDGKTSRGAIDKTSKRAGLVDKNATIADKLASGELSEDQADVIADTAARTDGVAATDQAFIDKVGSMNPDQARSVADDYVTDNADKDGTQSEHDRQRSQRRASTYTNKRNGLDAVDIAGDAVAVKNMWDTIKTRADEIYNADGGRDLNTGKHPRTRDQRLFDAAYEIICGVTTFATRTVYKPRGDGHNSTPAGSDPIDDCRIANDQGGKDPIVSRRVTPPKRPQIVIGLTLDHFLGKDASAVAEQIGLGAIPDSVLASYAEYADILAALYDRNGQPLFLARLHRHATETQRMALILRDRACVLCGASHTRCQVHHTMPWNAPGQGFTDLDQLVLLCGPCHNRLHADNQTVFRDRAGTWRTRPATAYETPPPPPPRLRTNRQQE